MNLQHLLSRHRHEGAADDFAPMNRLALTCYVSVGDEVSDATGDELGLDSEVVSKVEKTPEGGRSGPDSGL
jgi:hypothetical protein